MDQIEIEILQGSGAGRSAAFDGGELGFGRSPNNAIIVDVPEASREHGVLKYDADGWKVVNLSPNGTTVNGKRMRGEERLLRSGDRVGVGKLPLIKVQIHPGEAEDAEADPGGEVAPATAAAAGTEAQNQKKQQLKLYLAIAGVLGGALFIAVGFLAPLSSNGNGDGGPRVTQLSHTQIERIVTQPTEIDPTQREAQTALDTAREAYRNRELAADNLYEAYRNYKIAAAFDDGSLLDGEAYREYKDAEEMLVERVSRLYTEAYSQYRSGQWHEAEETCRTLQREYRRRDRLYESVNELLRIARRRQGR